jgi:hypothetical protein
MTFSDRFGWSLEMQTRHALDYYRSYFDLENIIQIDSVAEDNTELKSMDYSGLDTILYTAEGLPIHVAQRFRMKYYDKATETYRAPDFSLRYVSYDGETSEYKKLDMAHKHPHVSPPEIYAFGVTEHGRQPALSNGFSSFYLIDLRKFLRRHFDHGWLTEIEVTPNGDGSKGIYFSLSDLQQTGCILKSWGNNKSSDNNTTAVTLNND